MAAHFKQHDLNDTTDHAPGTNNTLLGTESNAVAEKSFGAAATASLIVQRQGNGQITLPAGDPVLATDAANKQYVDEQVVSGNTWKEILLAPEQLLSGGSGAVLQAELVTIATNLAAADTFIITDGTTTETWVAVAAGAVAFQFNVGGSAAATLTNLTAAINADSTLWSAVETSGLDAYFSGAELTQMVVYRTAYSAAADRIYGVIAGGQTDVQVVAFNAGDQDYRQASGAQTDLPSSDPTAKRFGFTRDFALLNGGDTHRIADDNTAFTWDSDDLIWQQTAQGSAVVEGDGIDITTNKVSTDVSVATAAQQYGGIVKNRTPDGSGSAAADAGHLAIQTDNTDLEITASNLLAIKALSRLDKYRADSAWTSSAGGDRSPTLAELNAALGTTANDIGNRCMLVEDGTAVASNSTFWAYKKANGGTLTDYHLVEMSEA